MDAQETTHRNQLSYQEVLAALPAYAQGTLDPQQHAAVDAYLNRQVDLFRQLDTVEATRLPAAKSTIFPMRQSRQAHKQLSSTVALAQVMEGYLSTQQLPDNPLLMRKAPQRITDQRTGQRFIVPRRNAAQSSRNGKYPYGEQPTRWANPLLWGILALAAVAAMTLIGLYQLRLQQLLAAAESALVARQGPTIIANQPRLIDTFGLTPPTTAWLTSESQPRTPLGTLFIDDQQGVLVIQQLPALPTGQVYQLWRIDQLANQHNITTFAVADAQQAQWVPFKLPTGISNTVQMGISVEPAGGSAQPSSNFLLTTTLR